MIKSIAFYGNPAKINTVVMVFVGSFIQCHQDIQPGQLRCTGLIFLWAAAHSQFEITGEFLTRV
jgi:hypothetical protein